MSHLREFEDKKLISGDSADLKLDEFAPPAAENALNADQTAELAKWMKETLGERVREVKPGDRLIDSPAMALNTDFMGAHMRRMMRAMNTDGGEDKVVVDLQINPRHALIVGLNNLRTAKPEFAQLITEQILDNALISAGLLDDSRSMVTRLNKILENAAK